MSSPLPRAARRCALTKVVLTERTKTAADYSFIERKLHHMRSVMGLEAAIGQHGGAAPKWLLDEQKERRNKQTRRLINGA